MAENQREALFSRKSRKGSDELEFQVPCLCCSFPACVLSEHRLKHSRTLSVGEAWAMFHPPALSSRVPLHWHGALQAPEPALASTLCEAPAWF